jgi:homoserine dehydrogenase
MVRGHFHSPWLLSMAFKEKPLKLTHRPRVQTDLSPKPPFLVGLAGVGNVGRAVAELLDRNADLITARAGRPIRLTAIASRRLRPAPAWLPTGAKALPSVFDLPSQEDLDVVVEAIGGTGDAWELSRAALTHGKHLVTANKALLSERWTELCALSHATGCHLRFEAAVASALPVVKCLGEGLAANRISSILAILNGTCNHILTRMQNDGLDYEQALREAQRLGVAEADPRLDVEGIDAAQKLSILATLAFGRHFRPSMFPVRGISSIEPQDLELASMAGMRVKLIAYCARAMGSVRLRVGCAMLDHAHRLASVDGALNAVLVDGDACGETAFIGAGAGGLAAASAIVADLVEVATRADERAREWTPLPAAALGLAGQQPAPTFAGRFFVRLSFPMHARAAELAQTVLAEEGIQMLWRRELGARDGQTHLAIATSQAAEAALDSALRRIQGQIANARLAKFDLI